MNPLETYYQLTTPIPIDGLRDANGVVVNFLALITELTRQDCLTPLYASTIESFASIRVDRTPDYS